MRQLGVNEAAAKADGEFVPQGTNARSRLKTSAPSTDCRAAQVYSSPKLTMNALDRVPFMPGMMAGGRAVVWRKIFRRWPSLFRFDGEMQGLVFWQQGLDEGDAVGDEAGDVRGGVLGDAVGVMEKGVGEEG